MTLTPATRRARGQNPRARRELETAIGQVAYMVERYHAITGWWPTVSNLAESLAHTNGWSMFEANRRRLSQWLRNGTLRGSKLRVRTGADGVVRIEMTGETQCAL